MKILNISLDKKIADKNSAAAQRMVEYGNLVERYTIIVLADKDQEFNLAAKVKVIAVRKSNKFFSLLKLKKKISTILRAEKYDVLTVQDVYFIGWLAVKLAKQFKLGLELQVHGLEKFSGLRKILAKKILPQANAVRAVSQRLKRQLVSEFGVRAEKITVVPIYTERATHNAQRITHNSERFIFLTVGRLVSVKNIAMQIDAIAKLVKKYVSVELLIVGDGDQRKTLEQMCCALRVARYVKFFGWQNDLDQFYQQADAFLLTSNSEGWGIAVLEAAAHGLPIIMTDVGLAGEVIKEGESGIIIPTQDQEALTNAMVILIENEQLLQKLGQGALVALQKLPTKEETLALYKKSWEKAVANLPI
ncbi:MAG: glycosyltransferase family 4 protein [Patescibacteria group bacterium]